MFFTEYPYLQISEKSFGKSWAAAKSFLPNWAQKVFDEVQSQRDLLKDSNGEQDIDIDEEKYNEVFARSIPDYCDAFAARLSLAKLIEKSGSDGTQLPLIVIPLMIVPSDEPGVDYDVV